MKQVNTNNIVIKLLNLLFHQFVFGLNVIVIVILIVLFVVMVHAIDDGVGSTWCYYTKQ